MKKTEYTTVDLEVKSNHDVDCLVAALSAIDCLVQKYDWHEDYSVFLNVNCPFEGRNADECIARYCDELTALSPEARAEWDAAGFKEFYIGYHAGYEPHCFSTHLDQALVTRVAELGAGIGIALYSVREESAEQNDDDAPS